MSEDVKDANNFVVEAAIINFQDVTRNLLEAFIETSASKEDMRDVLQKYRDAVSVAYVALLNNDHDKAVSTLRKIVNK